MDLRALQTVALAAMSLSFFLAIMVGLPATGICFLTLAAILGLALHGISAIPVHSLEVPS
ncbi:MAG: hypothetical protein GX651_04880 [Methanomicrobiales archaeon]|nr:hypothetical protein [Methanomicrobiales archaeon]